jgi:subtilisin family serine protease
VAYQRQAGLKRPAVLALATAAVTALAMATSGSAQAKPAQLSTALYLIQVKGAPLASYTGGVAGITATKPADGAKLNPQSWNYQAYKDYLRSARANVLRGAGVDAKRTVTDYDTAFNGFAAKLTSAEAERLRRSSGVANVWKNEILRVDTISTPKFLGLDGPGGVWQRQFGDPAHAGEGIVIGSIDTGIWPENPSFAALPEPRPDQAVIDAKWHGECIAGADGPPVACNNKLIGARWYNASGLDTFPGEFHSPRDFDGHGSHTASTAGGNNGVTATINGSSVGTVSGMAPVARIAAYKALWEQGGTASGGTVDLVNAIDDAVADGVDVINYSISGSRAFVIDPVELAFFNAAAAGVFVAASAGNDGPGTSTVAHNSPWLTTVAASTHDRSATKTVTLGNAATYTGAGIGPGVGSSPLVDSVNSGLAGADPTQIAQCFIGTLDPAKVTGKIVLCARGGNARTDKSKAVQQAGGVGMILYNPTPNTLNADFHFVPSVHVDGTAGAAIKAYIAGNANPTAAISAGVMVTAEAPVMADFSSRGPALAGSGDLLKPDITAPGVDVIAAVAPPNHADNLWDTESGTSMSSPHIAGIAALIRSKNPTWSPMAVKSALLTTAGTVDNAGKAIQRAGANATPLDFGSGHVRPANAFDPGLVYQSGPTEWAQYACGIGQHFLVGEGTDVCDIVGSVDPSDLNYANIAVGDLAGKQTITRTVTNVSQRASVYFAKVAAPAGFTVAVNPPVIVVPPGRSVTFKVEITRTTAAFNTYAFGSLTWLDTRGHSVRSTIAVRPVPIAAPIETVQSGTSGSTTLSVRAGYNGTLTATPHGLVAANVTTNHLVGANTTFSTTNPTAGPSAAKVTVTVPAGTKIARFATFGADYGDGADIDLYLYASGSTTLLAASAGGTAEEAITIAAPGTYDIYVVQFALPSGVSEQDVKLNSFVVAPGAAGNLTATPASQPATLGGLRSVTVGWSGLTAGTHYLGVIEYGDGTTAQGQTIVAVNA